MKSRIFSAIFLGVGVILALGGFALAEEQKTPTDFQIEKIKSECSNIKNHLKKVRSTDTLKRVNLGQNYETIANNLMDRLNIATISSKLNGSELVQIASDFNQNFTDFKENYQIYERELVKVLNFNCGKSQEFYSELEKLRSLRAKLDQTTKTLSEISKKYLESVSKFKDEVK